ncbi:Protein CBG22289 [Caenorhabditis briggsae]|uniref:Protein CBG22289 n=1 Tax=Caenorhabditis briggsae TaxID=6238 RepID=A8Y1Z8_CAEBR|nr:Protein CBG22289 [Caenorhabditis briggsae]CAP38918.2 Protein CBG22289 [Caenorhabditis briggsae]
MSTYFQIVCHFYVRHSCFSIIYFNIFRTTLKMILSKYPSLVQQEILENLNNIDLLFLSFASKKMKKLIKSTQMNRFKSINSIGYYCDSTDQIWVLMNKSSANVCFSYRGRGRFMRIVVHSETENDYFQSNVSGKIIDFRFEYEYCLAFYRQPEKESVIKSIHNYFLDYFGSSVEYHWRAGDLTEYSRRKGHNPFIPPLRNVSFCVNTSLNWDFANMEQVETFFSSSPIFKSIRMNAIEITEPLNPESKFYQADSIEIHQDKVTVPAVLRHFQGRQAIINCNEYKTSDLIEFLIRWKSGEAFQKLEYLKIEMGRTPRVRFLNAIRLKYIDETKQPPTHSLPKIYDWYGRIKHTESITSHKYVVRATDNRVASIKVRREILWFGVWDKTEEEFLRIMD